MARPLVPHLTALLACFGLAGCTMQTYDTPADAAPSNLERGGFAPLGDAPAIREPWTECREVRDGDELLGYLVVYSPVPAHEKHVERRYPEGTILVEDPHFALIGFVTAQGKAYAFERGADVEVATGTLEEVLPAFFGKGRRLTHAPISGG
jgi:hypothetical protein